MIIHFFNDEKFVDNAILNFKKFEVEQRFIVIVNESCEVANLKYVKHTKSVEIVEYSKLNLFLRNLPFSNIRSAFFHFLDFIKADILLHFKKHNPSIKAFWFFWGADGYFLQKFENTLYQEKTKHFLLSQNNALISKIKKGIIDLFAKANIYLRDLRWPNSLLLDAMKQTDYIIPVIPEDYFLLKQKYRFEAEMIEWNYLSIDQLGMNLDSVVEEDHILLGNSSTQTNNHIEVIDLLTNLDLGNKKVFVPLSYGDTDYRTILLKYGQEKLGEKFFPIVDFIPLQEYINILRSCGIVIMNHKRQQAVGNVLIALWMGASLYLNEQSTLFAHLKNKGYSFYGLEDLFKKKKDFTFCKLKHQQIATNRNLILRDWSDERITEKTRLLISKAVKH
jgi:dTDP-N-acetylfucosamine:lipid II N-acetylfucosaminyltransferase